jgi:hypothetical protein
MFLLCETNENNSNALKRVYYLAKNDTNLKLTRVIFRYRNMLDRLFPQRQEPAQYIINPVIIPRLAANFGSKFEPSKML